MDFRLLQLADSAFPTGGFVHSGGLEAAARLGLVRALAPWLRDSLSQAGRGALPLATAGFANDPEVEEIADAWLTNEVAHRASRAQGVAWISTAAAVFPDPALTELKQRARRGEIGHFAPAFGRVCAILGVERAEMQRIFLFLHLRGQVSTAVRLGLIGPLEAQRLQATFTPVLDAVHAQCAELELAELATIAPLHDLAHAHHDRLYSRMFAT